MNDVSKRDRKSDLFRGILERARSDGSLCRIEPVLEYLLPNDNEPFDAGSDSELTNYRFDFCPCMSFDCEGIFVELRLVGDFDCSGRRQTSLGVFKTLRQDLDACRLMGELCGVLMYHGRGYVNDNILRYTPDQKTPSMNFEKEIEHHDIHCVERTVSRI